MVRIVLFLSTGTFLISPSETTSCSVLLLFDLTQAMCPSKGVRPSLIF